VGSFIAASSGILAKSPLRAASFAISPILVFGLLYKLSGIPILERNSDKKFGKLESYQEYKKNVPELIPRFTAYKAKTD
jgi:steroid 5-alpha reductase family enzyme